MNRHVGAAWLSRLRQGHWTLISVIAFALFMDYLIYGLAIPLAPYSPAGIDSGQKVAVLSLGYGLGVLLSTPVFGYLGDRFGCRLPMLCGVALAAVATLLIGVAPGFGVLLLGRFIQGVASAATWTAGLALVAMAYPLKRVQMLGIAMTGGSTGLIVGPVIGGWLHSVGGYAVPFMVAGGLLGVDAFLRVLLVPKSAARAGKGPRVRKLLFNRSIAVPALSVMLAASAWGVVEPLLPNHLSSVASAGPGLIGLLFAIAAAVGGLGAPLAEFVSERVGLKRTMVIGTVATATALPLLAAFSSLVFVGMALALVSLSFSLLINPASAELGNAVERLGTSSYAAAYAAFNIAYSIGMMSAGAFAAALSPHFALAHILVFTSSVLLVCLLLIVRTETAPPAVGREPAVP